MTIRNIAAVAALTLFAFPVAVQAQSGAAAGATTGAVGGAIVGGPVGAVVGGVGGAIVGGLSDQQRPEFRNYVVQVRVGARLPASGVTYYEVPAQYGVKEYRYTIVNDRPVLVDPRSHTIVQVIE